jgi:hypothetical protein
LRWLVGAGSLPIATSKDIFKRAANAVFHLARKDGGRRGELVDGFHSKMLALATEVALSSATAMQPEPSLRSEREARFSTTVQNVSQSRAVEMNSFLSSSPKKRAKRQLIFPGAPSAEGANRETRNWDESQWID